MRAFYAATDGCLHKFVDPSQNPTYANDTQQLVRSHAFIISEYYVRSIHQIPSRKRAAPLDFLPTLTGDFLPTDGTDETCVRSDIEHQKNTESQ